MKMVNESTTDLFVPENALTGPIPTQIGQLGRLDLLRVDNNQLTGECRETHFIAIGKRVYHSQFLVHHALTRATRQTYALFLPQFLLEHLLTRTVTCTTIL